MKANRLSQPPDQDGWDKPEKCDGGAISGGGNYWMGSKFYPGPYNPFNCAHYAQAQTDTNKHLAQQRGHKSFTPVNMFNSYSEFSSYFTNTFRLKLTSTTVVHKNGRPQGTYCQIFDTHLSPKWAGYKGGNSGHDRFEVKNSWTYSMKNMLDGRL